MARKVTDKLAGLSEMDKEGADRIRGFVKQFGHAITLSCIAGVSSSKYEAETAHVAAEIAWDDLAVDIILFVLEDN